MFLVKAQSPVWYKRFLLRDVEKVTNNFCRAEQLLRHCVAQGFKEVYISDVGECEGVYETPLSRDLDATTRIKVLRDYTIKHRVVNVRLGKKLLELLSHFAMIAKKSQNAFVVQALENALDSDFGMSKVSLNDWAAACGDRAQYSIRIQRSLEAAWSQKADECGVNRSIWIMWALLVEMERVSKTEFEKIE